MKITVKCPNCFQQVSNDNRFCVFCGYDLSAATPAEPDTPSVTPAPEPPAPDPAAYDGPRFCPRGHDVFDPSLGFCPTCGSPLVYEPAGASDDIGPAASSFPAEEPSPSYTEPVALEKEPARFASRKCKCGYVCDDPELNFCPSCGMPLDDSGSVDDPGWVCVRCGARNESDLNFCCFCGKSRGSGGPDLEPEPTKKPVPAPRPEPAIPNGMKPPTDNDLNVKSTYNPW